MRTKLGKAFDVDLINHRFRKRDIGTFVTAPIKILANNNGLREAGCVIAGVLFQIAIVVAERIGKHFAAPFDEPCHGARIRIKQQLEFIKAIAFFRCIKPVNTIAVELTAGYVRQKAMPDTISNLRQPDSGAFLEIFGTSEQAEFDAGRVLREEGEVCSLSRNFCAKWIWLPGPNRRGGLTSHTLG